MEEKGADGRDLGHTHECLQIAKSTILLPRFPTLKKVTKYIETAIVKDNPGQNPGKKSLQLSSSCF